MTHIPFPARYCPLRVSSALVPDKHVDLLLFEHDGVQHYTREFSRLVGRQLSIHGHTVHWCRRDLHANSSQELLDAHALDCCHAERQNFPRTHTADSPTSRNSYWHRLQYTLTLNRSYIGSTTMKQWILHRVLQRVAMNQQQIRDPSKSFTYKLVSSVVPDFSRPGRCLCASCKRKRSSCFRSTLPLPNKC